MPIGDPPDDPAPASGNAGAFLRLVFAGGACGAVTRWGVTELASGVGTTVALNVLGSLLLGWLAARSRFKALWWFGAVGFCGGLTTFSRFALDAAIWLDGDRVADGIGMIVATTLGAIGAALTGYALGSRRIGARA